jgi:plasmid stabilization system protein ParE
VKVVLVEDAAEQTETIDRWWRENRPSAADLFANELIAALRLVAEAPLIGGPYRKKYRRLRLQRTHHHVYYEVDHEADVITVVAVWGMPKAKPPSL